MTEYIDRNIQLVRLYRLNLDCKEVIKEFLMTASTVEAEPVKRAYILTDENGNIKCSNCKSSECWGNYCMNCGAKMDGKEKSDG